MSVVNGYDTDADFQVLSVATAEEAAKRIYLMHSHGYEHYDTQRGSWDSEGVYSHGGMTLFFRKHKLSNNTAQGKAAYRGARPEGATKK